LARNGEPMHALGNVALSVGLCLAAVSFGFVLADGLGG
jgi:CrcB protein